MAKNYLLKAFLMLALLFLFFVTFFWLVPFEEFFLTLWNTQVSFFLGAIAFFLTALFLNAWRWALVLSATSERIAFSVGYLFKIVCISFMLNNLLPLRIGELAKPWLASKRLKISLPIALNTLFLERFFDLVALAFLALSVALSGELLGRIYDSFGKALQMLGLSEIQAMEVVFTAQMVSWMLVLLLCFLTVLLCLLLFLPSFSWRIQAIFRKILFFLPLNHKIFVFLEQALNHLFLLKNLKKSALLLGLSGIIWACFGFSLFCFLHAFWLPVSVMGGVFVLVLTALSLSIPSTPAGLGAFEMSFTVGTLAVLGFGEAGMAVRASSAALATHGVHMLLSFGFGGFFLWQEPWRLKTLVPVFFKKKQ